ncbi:MAG TPA: FkbM family methyltransferase [Cyclobacteriaceae bacterium]|nr:FkbM family methyltransferase [Cyclobacteriaceae bacterium]
MSLKRIFKRNTHNFLFQAISSAGRSINRLYENRNHDTQSNGEEWLINRIAKINPKFIFDVGANTGKYALLAKKHNPVANVVCFEPVKSTFEKLKTVTAPLSNITLVNSGLFDENKKLTINIYPSHTHASVFDLKAIPYESVGKEEIDLIVGDDYMKKNNIESVDLLKLDVEGAELNAIRGFKNALSNKKIRIIQFEYGYINITTKNLLIDYYEYLDQFGYAVGKLYPKKVEFRKYQFKYEDFIGPNMIAIRKDDSELKQLLS